MDFRDGRLKNFEHGWSRARNQLIIYLLTSLKQAKGDWTILDIGCGTGEQLRFFQFFGKVVGIDINPEAKKNNNSIITADIETRPLSINNYDLICCFDILEHLETDRQVLFNCQRALKPNGHLLLTVPAYGWLFSPHDKALGHKRRYYYQELKNKLKNANFTILELHYWNSLLLLPIIVFRLCKKMLNQPEKSELNIMPAWLNNFIYKCLSVDNYLIKHNYHTPWGLNLYAVAKKNEN